MCWITAIAGPASPRCSAPPDFPRPSFLKCLPRGACIQRGLSRSRRRSPAHFFSKKSADGGSTSGKESGSNNDEEEHNTLAADGRKRAREGEPLDRRPLGRGRPRWKLF